MCSLTSRPQHKITCRLLLQANRAHNEAADAIISGMIVNKTKISFERPWTGISIERQWQANEAAGAQFRANTKRYAMGWEEVLNLSSKRTPRSEGWTLYVYLLALLPNPKEEKQPAPAAQLSLIIGEIKARGWTVVESYSGRRSDNLKQWREMVEWAHASLAKGTRNAPPGFAKPGRKRGVSAEAHEAALKVWQDLDYPTDNAAARHFPEGVNLAYARRWFKPSGRKPGAKKQRKRSRHA